MLEPSAAATSARPATPASVPAGPAQGLPAAKTSMPALMLVVPHLRALLPGEERKERPAVHEQDAVADARLRLSRRRCGREREGRLQGLSVRRRDGDRHLVGGRRGEAVERDDMARDLRRRSVPQHRRSSHRAPAHLRRRGLRRRPRDRRRVRRHVERPCTRERERPGRRRRRSRGRWRASRPAGPPPRYPST